MRTRLVLLVALYGISGLYAESPLYWALANNDAVEVWQAEDLPEMLEENGLTAPAWAVARGNAEALDVLIWRGVSLDKVDGQGRNLLFEAAALGRLDLFEKILTQGAKVDKVDVQGQTLVHAAARAPHPEMLEWLLAQGLGGTTRTELGVTPLMVACGERRRTAVETLLKWGAVPEDQDFLGRSVKDYAEAGGDPGTLELIDATLTPWTIEPAGKAPPL